MTIQRPKFGLKNAAKYFSSFHPDLNKKDVMALFDLDFIGKHKNVIFLGPAGVGKTHLPLADQGVGNLGGHRCDAVHRSL